MNWPTRDLLNLVRWMLLALFRSGTSLRAENLALRHQLNVLHRSSLKRPVLTNFDRLIFVCLYRIAPRVQSFGLEILRATPARSSLNVDQTKWKLAAVRLEAVTFCNVTVSFASNVITVLVPTCDMCD